MKKLPPVGRSYQNRLPGAVKVMLHHLCDLEVRIYLMARIPARRGLKNVIREGINRGEIDTRAIAPAIGKYLGIPPPAADLSALVVESSRAAIQLSA